MKRSFQLSHATALVSLLTAACTSSTIVTPPIQEVMIHIEGTVTIENTSDPIPGALAEVRTLNTGALFAEATTDSAGAYVLEFLYRYFQGERDFCPFLFLVTASGYIGQTPNFQCVSGVQTIDVELIP